MHSDTSSLLLVFTLNMVAMAVALPAVMGRLHPAARQAQAGIVLQAGGWVLLLCSELVERGAWGDRLLSTLSMAGISAGLAYNAGAFALWCGHRPTRWQAGLALAMTSGYFLMFDSYALRVGWANGLLALQTALIMAGLARRPRQPVGRWRWLLAASFGVQAVVTAWRGLLGALDGGGAMPSFFAGHPVNVAFALVANVTSMLSLAGMLLAHRDEAARGLEKLAALDGLTGVLNRRAWLERCQPELALARRHGHALALLLLDLDHFKRINDQGGHEAGDRALQFFAAALQDSCREGDMLCRYGGEEFCVLMRHADAGAARAFDQRLRQVLRESAQQHLGHALCYSAGVALHGGGADTLEAMLRRADRQLYAAKERGRDCTLAADGQAWALAA